MDLVKQTDYVYSVSYIRAIETKLLSDSDFESMILADSFDSAARVLVDKGYSDSKITENNLDAVLKRQSELSWDEVLWAAPKENLTKILIFKNDFHNLKAVLKCIASGKSNFSDYILEPSTIDYKIYVSAAANGNFTELPSHMSSCAKKAYELLNETGDGGISEAIIDKACMDYMYKYAKESGSEFLEGFIKLQNTFYNIKIAKRAENAKKDKEFLQNSLAENSNINILGLISSVLSHSVTEYIASSGMEDVAEKLNISYSEFEKYADNKISQYLKDTKYIIMGVEPLISYILRKQTEIQNVRVILSAKLNGISPDIIRNRIREV